MTRLLENALFGTALILAAAVLRRALKGRLLPGARLALWAGCLFRLLAPAFPTSGLSLWGLLPRAGEAPAATPVIGPLPLPGGTVGDVPAANLPAGAANPVLPAAGAAFSWEMVLPAVWIGVGALLAVRYALAYARTRRAVADAIPLGRDDPRYALLPRCARLREGVMDGAPLTFGAVRPTVVVPPGLSGGALDCVLAHEGVHARRRDNLWHYAMAAALAVYWWDPAVWLMARLLRRDIELACDRAAVRKLGADRRAEYAETLVALATAGAEPAFCRTFGRKAAEERILSVMKFKKTTVLGAVLSLVLVVGVTAAFASGPRASAEKPAESNAPVIVENGDPVPVNTSPVITEDGEPGATADEPMTLEEYKALLDGLVSGGKMSQEDYNRLLEGAAKGLESQISVGACPYLWVTEGGSYAIKGGRICTLAGCGNNSRHTHNGEWYTGWTGKTTIPPLCTDEDCAVSGPHYHQQDGEVVHCYDTLPAEIPVCPVAGCTKVTAHQHDGRWYCFVHPVCPVEGCTAAGEHVHDGVVYSCNGAGHSVDGGCNGSCAIPLCPVEGCAVRGRHIHDGVAYRCGGDVCDGSCLVYGGGAAPIACPPETIDQNFPSRTGCYPDESGRHGDSHHGNGYQGGHH